MPIFKCPIDDCTYQTEDIDAGVAVAMLTIHNNVHVGRPILLKEYLLIPIKGIPK